MPSITYEQRATAFIDVLGFKQLVDASVADATSRRELESLVGILESAIPVFDSGVSTTVPRRLIPKHTYISDCIILSAPLDDPKVQDYSGLETVVMRCIQLTHRMLDAGYLLRGGISVGPLWHGNGNIVGPPYQEAYLLERDGKEPRLVLSNSARDRWSKGFGSGSRMCILEGDTVMVNGLHDFYVPDRSYGGVERAFERYAAIARNRIASPLSQSAKSKWLWFLEYLEAERTEAEKWLGA